MILSISLALLVAGTLLVAFNKTDIPEIPIYLASGALLSVITAFAASNNIVSHNFVETEIMKELALLGLSILIFYRASGLKIDSNRMISVDSFKTSVFTSSVLLTSVTGISMYLGFPVFESLIFGVSSAVGSTLLDSGIVTEETRKKKIYGWLTEDINFFDDLFCIVLFTLIISNVVQVSATLAVMTSMASIITAFLIRKKYSQLVLKITDGKNELLLLSGIATLISLISITKFAGITELAGIYAAGLILVNSELGFKVRERFSSVKDFFTALSFIAIGYILSIPSPIYLIASAIIFLSVMIIRPVIITLMLRLQGYDLRSSFMASIQSAQISEIALVAVLLLTSTTSGDVLSALVLSFTGSVIIVNMIQSNENKIFDRIFSNYELDPEKSDIPHDLGDHIILAGYDWKTKGLKDLTDKQVIAIDYDLEQIEEADENGVYHLLADIYSDQAWEKSSVKNASIIVSAIRDDKLLNRIEDMEVQAKKILVRESSDEIDEELRNMLREDL
jgi:Kef-type K+ transport system membrane component KefB